MEILAFGWNINGFWTIAIGSIIVVPNYFYYDNFGWFTLDFVFHYHHPPLPWTSGRPLHYEHHLFTFGALIVAIPGVSLFGITCTTITTSCPYLRATLNLTRKKGGVLGSWAHARLLVNSIVSTPNCFSRPPCVYFHERPLQQMDHKENDQDHQPADAKTLVNALTNLMLDDPTPPLEMHGRPIAESMQPANAHGDADTALTNFTGNSSLNDVPPNGDRRTPPTPAFLEDRHVREALLRANSLRPQGHLDDEPHFPSSFMGTHSRLRVEGEWGGALGNLPLNEPARVAYPLVAYPDTSYAPRYPALNQAHPGIGTRFQPGQETASVLQITKRPQRCLAPTVSWQQ
jgi:hypothetical protein